MKKRIIALFLVVVLIIAMAPAVSAARVYTYEENIAYGLRELGLFKGVSTTSVDFALEKTMTRAQAIIMFVRMLGFEKQALEKNYSHPFKDVPDWADAYVGWAYHEGYTTGVTSTRYGSDNKTSLQDYLTFLLRALRYTDRGENKDFTWSNPYDLAREVGFMIDGISNSNFLRADAVALSWTALNSELGHSPNGMELWLLLSQAGVIDMDKFREVSIKIDFLDYTTSVENYVDGVEIGNYTCYEDPNSNFVYPEQFRPMITINADHTFTARKGVGEWMEEGWGTWSVRKPADSDPIITLNVETSDYYWYGDKNIELYVTHEGLVLMESMGTAFPPSVFVLDI